MKGSFHAIINVRAALRDSDLHELLALCDVLRIGRAREKNLSTDILEQRILGKDTP
jgi:hypothetical protein